MGKKRKSLSPDEWAEEQRRAAETLRSLQERIDYHRAILVEQYGPEYRTPTLEERIAYHRARLQEEQAEAP